MTIPVAILAGGLATRLGEVTKSVPKSLLDIAGKPFAVRQIEMLAAAGFRDIVFLVGHLGVQLREVLGDGSRWNVRIRYCEDGPKLLGTGGALRKALPLLGDAFFVLNGDSYLECDYAAIERSFLDSGAPALMTVFRNEDRFDRSNIEYREGKIVRYDKVHRTPAMQHIDYGLTGLRASVLSKLAENEPADLASLLCALSTEGHVAAYEVPRRFFEIGSHSGLAETRSYVLGKGEAAVGYAKQHLAEAVRIIETLDTDAIERAAALLLQVRERGGRLFLLGVGGSAANCSHAVNDFRKICGFEAYAPTDNVSELTARTNDEGWASIFVEWLRVSRLTAKDAVFVFSVGGGNLEKNVSPNLVSALQYAKEVGASVLGIVGRDGGYTGRVADVCMLIPTVNAETITPHAEAFQAVVWHLLVSHPALKIKQTKWESTK